MYKGTLEMSHFFLFLLIHLYSGLLELLRLLLSFSDRMCIRIPAWHIRERFGLPPVDKNFKGCTVVWIHAASLGEVKIIYKFLNILEEKYPDFSYVLTAVTESGVNYLRRHKTASVCAVGFMPLDTISLMKRMLERFNVSRLWLVETEIWPAMLWTCFNKNIPVGIVNARMEEKSFKIYRRFLSGLKLLFGHIDVVLAQDKTYAARFEAMGTSPAAIHTIGNIKSRIVIKPHSSEQKESFRRSMNLDPDNIVITAGCIHPGEAAIIKRTADILIAKGYRWKWIVVPRHLNKSPGILKELGQDTLRVKSIDLSVEWNMCLIEAFGVLEDMYMIADSAILGGTFITVGGHNVWEAVQYAIPLFFGPDYHAQRESCERILSAGVGFCVHSADELAEGLIKVLINDASDFSSAMSNFIDTMKKSLFSLESFIP